MSEPVQQAKRVVASTPLIAARTTRFERSRWPFLLLGLALAMLCAFLLLPGSIAAKAHLALHGICAQRPSHSLSIGGAPLPLDARMTGIYVGAAVTVAWLIATETMRATRPPSRRVIGILALFVIVMGADGFNALAFDLGIPHPYRPSNVLRLVTGILGGTTMGVALMYMFASTMWKGADRSKAIVATTRALLIPLSAGFVVGALILSGLPVLYTPVAVGLLLAAIGVFTTLSTILLALATRRSWTFGTLSEMGGLALAGLVVASGLMAALAAGRIALETWFGLLVLS